MGQLKEAWVPYFKMDVSMPTMKLNLAMPAGTPRAMLTTSSIKKTVYEMNDDNVTLMLASTK